MIRTVQTRAWVYEYSGNDCTWVVWRTVLVTTPRRRYARL